MAGTFAVINPRRRRRHSRRRRRASTTRRRRRSTRRVARFTAAPRRRRRSHRRRRSARRRRYSNPRMRGFNLGGVDVGQAALIGGGVIGTNLVTPFITNFLPPDWKTGPNAPLARLGIKAAVGVGAPMMLRRFIGARVSNLLAIGGAISVLIDAWVTWGAPALGLPAGVSGYEMLGEYDQLGQIDTGDETALGAAENIYSDTIY